MSLLPTAFPFLYVYKHKRSVHIRVADSWLTLEPNYWRSSARRAYSVAECVAQGIPESFLTEYLLATRAYFHARMAMLQNRPVKSEPLDNALKEILGPCLKDIELARAHRYKAARVVRNRAWSDLASLRKKVRALLPTF
jgi:hypothetical protein